MGVAVKHDRTDWDLGKKEYRARIALSKLLSVGASSKIVLPQQAVAFLESLIRPGDRVALEGNNQKQADFLANCLAQVDPQKVNQLHMVQSVIALPAHCALFEKGIASKIDFSFSGPQAANVIRLVNQGKMKIGEIHTYLELYSRYFLDLTPRVALIAAITADRQGNLYTGPNTEDTPAVVEATHFKNGIVVAQVERIDDSLPRVDIPGDWVDFVIPTGKPCHMEPLFTRDPAKIRNAHILMAMLVIKGIYAQYGVRSLNHGIGYATAAIELLLPTYAEQLGLKGKICTHWLLNPHPTLIPAIEAGFIEVIHSPGSEIGTEEYVAARSDVFFVGPDGALRSNRAFAQAVGHYAVDAFVGATLQIDRFGNSSTAVTDRIAGFGGAPNMGCDPPGRRHSSQAWIKAGHETCMNSSLIGDMPRGRKLVVQILETRGPEGLPCYVEKLDAWGLMQRAGFSFPPVMIFGDAITQIVSEHGIAHLHKCGSLNERQAAIKAIAGDTELGKQAIVQQTEELRRRRIVETPQDLDIHISDVTRSLLAAQSMDDLVAWSAGLYKIPQKFR